MAEMTLEQQQALALASARLRVPSTGEDILSSGPQYGVTAASSLLGLPGDIVKGGRWVGEKIGLGDPSNNARIMGSQEVAQDIGKMTGPLYQPQTTVGKGLNTAASLLPAAIGGPESIAAKLATRVAAPAAAITGIENSPIPEGVKPWAEGATLLLSPFAANKVVGSTLKIASSGVMPTTTQIRGTEKALYGIAKMTGTKVEKGTFQQFYQAAEDNFMKRYQGNERIFSNNDVKSFTTLADMRRFAKGGLEPSLQTMHDWRRGLGKAMGKDRNDSAGEFYGEFQNFFKHLDQNPQALTGSGKATAIQAMRAADEMHSRYKNSKLMDQYLQTAKFRSGKNYTQATSATAIRQELGKMATDVVKAEKSKYARFLTPEMKDQLFKTVEGTKAMNAAKKLSTAAPTSLNSIKNAGTLGAIGTYLGGPLAGTVAGAIPPIVGTAAKLAYPVLTKKEAQKFIDMIKKGRPVPGTPTYFPRPSQPLNYPPLLPPLVLQQLLNKNSTQ